MLNLAAKAFLVQDGKDRYGGKTTLHHLYYFSFCTESTSKSIL